MEAQICVESGNVVFPLLNEHSGFLDAGVGRGPKLKTLADNSVSTWLDLEDGGLLSHFLEFGCCSSPCAATPPPSARATGLASATGFSSPLLAFYHPLAEE